MAGPSCPEKTLMGGVMGAVIGGAMGSLFGIFEVLQTKQFNPARFGKAAAGSAAVRPPRVFFVAAWGCSAQLHACCSMCLCVCRLVSHERSAVGIAAQAFGVFMAVGTAVRTC